MPSIKPTTVGDILGDDDLDLSKVLTDEELKAVPPEEKIKRLSSLCRQQLQIETELSELEQALVNKKLELEKVSEHEIPDLMDELGIDEFRLRSGIRVTVVPYFSGKITTPEALDWLEENEHGDIIKGSITIPYPKGYEQGKLKAIVDMAQALGLPADNREEVHHSTLRAWIKVMVLTGQDFPRELFNVYVGRETKLKVK